MRQLKLILFFCILPLLLFSQKKEEKAYYDQLFQQANTLINTYQFRKAQDILSECYINYPENIQYLSKIAYCNFQLGRYKDAKLFYGEILKLDSINTTARSGLGRIYEREANYVKAKEQYAILIEIDSTNAYYHKRNAYMALRLGDPIAAIYAFSQAFVLNEYDIEVIDQLSTIYLTLGDLEATETMLKKGLEQDAQNIKLLQTKARLNQKRKEHETVIEAIEAIMIQGDTSTYYQMMLGVAYLHVDSTEKAIVHLQAIIDRKKDTEHTHHYLGLAYRQQQELDKSVEHFEQAIELAISPKIETYHSDLASTLEAQYQYKQAAQHFAEAFGYSKNQEYLFHQARNYDLYYKDKSIALKYYKKYLATNDKKYKEYTTQRIEQLKEIVHFQK